jgi:leucyl/phenylalanyl-tRNA--protein transferase
MGIFPWYSEGMPILWWSPDPRLVLFPDELKVSSSLRRTIKKGLFQTSFDQAFQDVIRQCGEVRRRSGEGTWLVPEMIEAYRGLHLQGYAHSVETWLDGELVGGLYGLALGRVFFGESMFSLRSDASKVALAQLVQWLREWSYEIIDCQVETQHLKRFGAREIPRPIFLGIVMRGVDREPHPSAWTCPSGEDGHG